MVCIIHIAAKNLQKIMKKLYRLLVTIQKCIDKRKIQIRVHSMTPWSMHTHTHNPYWHSLTAAVSIVFAGIELLSPGQVSGTSRHVIQHALNSLSYGWQHFQKSSFLVGHYKELSSAHEKMIISSTCTLKSLKYHVLPVRIKNLLCLIRYKYLWYVDQSYYQRCNDQNSSIEQ